MVITSRRRKLGLLAASALAPLSLGLSEPALAANECGPLDISGSVTCTLAGNNYTGGISYSSPSPTDLHVTLNSDVNVTLSGVGTGVAVLNNLGGQAILDANGATVNATATGAANVGLHAQSQFGNAVVTASGPILVSGDSGQLGIGAFAGGALASVTYDGPGVISSGFVSTAIQAANFGTGDAKIEVFSGIFTGNVPGPGLPNGISGLFATADNGSATVLFHKGAINVEGFFSNGIFASGGSQGSATVITDPGTTITVSVLSSGDKLKPGIAAETSGSAAANNFVTVVAQSVIKTLCTAARF
jgi:hypothetical protein